MRREVLTIPHTTLHSPASPVTGIDGEVLDVCRDLVDTMRAAGHSVGVAAPQIGVALRAFCVDVTGHPKADSCHGEIVLVNPVVLTASDPVIGREGCMSVPDLTGDVSRASTVVVRGTAPTGEVRVVEANAFEARALQHEIAHLDGKVFLDEVVSARRVFRRKTYR
ncbi:MAG: peptide deformylase [Acidimicrobiia bacterium]|nr:peptide deformylase [Acidimicrobiia bacterium]